MDCFDYLLEFAHYNRLEVTVSIDPCSKRYEVDLIDSDSKDDFDVKDGICLTCRSYSGLTLAEAAKELLENTLDKTMVFDPNGGNLRREIKGAYLNMPGRVYGKLGERFDYDSLKCFYDQINRLSTCQDCTYVECGYRPKAGGTYRYNCPLYKSPKEKQNG